MPFIYLFHSQLKLEIIHIFWILEWPKIQTQIKIIILGGMPPCPLALSMLHMLIVLCTMVHISRPLSLPYALLS